jgi:hypothetical protein
MWPITDCYSLWNTEAIGSGRCHLAVFHGVQTQRELPDDGIGSVPKWGLPLMRHPLGRR